MSEAVDRAPDLTSQDLEGLHRRIDWKGAFWVASGVPALVLFSIGSIAATIGSPSPLVWTISIAFGLIQAFTYAEIAGLYPNKSGGASVYGAMAWVRYVKFVAPMSVWCNWLAWSPVLMIGSSLAAGYILTGLFPADATINTWSVSLVDLGWLQDGLELRFSFSFILAAILLLLVFAAQHRGILETARIQLIMGVAVLLPLLVVGVVPLLTGDVAGGSFSPFEPLTGAWDATGWSWFAGGLFLAAWSTYGFETAVCYTREFKNPATDTPKAIFSAGLVCLVIFVLVPFSFQGSLGVERLTEADIVAGTGVADAMADMVGGGAVIHNLIVVMLILALLLTIMTTMAGSSRTLYQGSKDGLLPRYLSKTNEHGAPTRAMWTDLTANLLLLLMSSTLFVLAASTVCYMIFNFLNLNSGWIHRLDRPQRPRPWKAPTAMIGLGAVLGFVNALLIGWGIGAWGVGNGALYAGLIGAALIIPISAYRHYYQDGGQFPPHMAADIAVAEHDTTTGRSGAGVLPYLALAGGVAAVIIGQLLAEF